MRERARAPNFADTHVCKRPGVAIPLVSRVCVKLTFDKHTTPYSKLWVRKDPSVYTWRENSEQVMKPYGWLRGTSKAGIVALKRQMGSRRKEM